MRSAIVVGLLLSALLLSSVFISSCESETPFEPGDPPDSVGDDFTKIESVEEAQLIVASFDSLNVTHIYHLTSGAIFLPRILKSIPPSPATPQALPTFSLRAGRP